MSAGPIFTLPEIARRTGAEYRTLRSWVERGIVTPSVQHNTTGKPGTPDLFSERDARMVATLVELRKRGLDIEGIRAVAVTLAEHDQVLCPICISKPIPLATPQKPGGEEVG